MFISKWKRLYCPFRGGTVSKFLYLEQTAGEGLKLCQPPPDVYSGKGSEAVMSDDKKPIRDERDHPEQYPTDKPSLFDVDEDQQNVDPIPVEDLTLEKEEEKDKETTKHRSSSDKRYHTGF